MSDPRPRLSGKAALPPKGRYKDTPDLNGGILRQVKALGQRIAHEDPDDLLLLVKVEQELKQAWVTAIAGIRRSGFTDRDIGRALGTTRQAVEQRWPRVALGGGQL